METLAHENEGARLTAAQRRALETISRARVLRVTNGWRGRGTPMIQISTARSLIEHGLARAVLVQFQKELVATAAGRDLLKRERPQ